jgi:hypothetical protein
VTVRRTPLIAAAACALTLGLALQARALYVVMHFGSSRFEAATAEQNGWPKGTLELVNTPLRQDAWHPFFSECPNDRYYFGFKPRTIREMNEIMELLARVDPKCAVILSPERVGQGEEKGMTAVFSLGSQKIMDQWFLRLPDGKFGVHKFEAAPKVPAPQMTLHVGALAAELSGLRVPPDMILGAGISADYRKANPKDAVVDAIDRAVATNRKINQL